MELSNCITPKITHHNFDVCIDDNGYYKIHVFDKEEFSVNDLKLLVKSQEELGCQKLPVLVICKEHSATNVELLRELSKNKNNPYSKADAFVISSMAQKIFANFYLKISTPERPTKFFNDTTEAIKWLKQFV